MKNYHSRTMIYIVLLIGIVIVVAATISYHIYTHNTKQGTPNQPHPTVPTSTPQAGPVMPAEMQYYPEDFTKQLLSRSTSFSTDDYAATILESPFLTQDARVWIIMRNPGLLDMPSVPLGTYKGTLNQLATAERVVDFYNKAFIAPKNTDQATKLLEELLSVIYFRDEFGYANNATTGRGYRVISSVNDIEGIVNSLKDVEINFTITPPATLQQENKYYVSSLWFWGSHNCKLHHATLTTDGAKIISIDIKEVGTFGTCHGLFYE